MTEGCQEEIIYDRCRPKHADHRHLPVSENREDLITATLSIGIVGEQELACHKISTGALFDKVICGVDVC